MTDHHQHDPKRDRREAVRAAARTLREEDRRRSRRRRVLGIGAVTICALVGGLAVTMAVVGAVQPPAVPRNTHSGAILVGNSRSDSPRVTIFQDYLCPHCGTFESANGERLASLVASDAVALEVHPLAILTTMSSGTKYSLRAANAAACVADLEPATFLAFNQALFAHQPEENSVGLTNAELTDLVPKSGATTAIGSCIDNGTFTRWVQSETNRATTSPVPGSKLERVASTPTILVDGIPFTGDISDPDAFAAFLKR